MAETGILAYHSKIWLGTRPECPDRITAFVPVDLLHFSTALYLIICGIHLSTMILCVEIALHRYQLFKDINLQDILKNRFSFGELDGKIN